MNKTALITGASSGIGLELATIFAQNKINLILVARNKTKLEELSQELSRKYSVTCAVIPTDLSKAGSAQEVFNACHSENHPVSYLINNAGYGDYGLFQDCDLQNQLNMIQLNITTLTELTRLFLPGMIQNKYGKILNVASTAAFIPGPKMSVYFATKAYVLSFSEALHEELKGKGISVTTLCPGPTQSDFFNKAQMNEAGMVKGRNMPSSRDVAEFGYKKLMANEAVAIHGFMNYLMANSARFTPRSIVRKIVGKVIG
jgi:uncharacterized protein